MPLLYPHFEMTPYKDISLDNIYFNYKVSLPSSQSYEGEKGSFKINTVFTGSYRLH